MLDNHITEHGVQFETIIYQQKIVLGIPLSLRRFGPTGCVLQTPHTGGVQFRPHDMVQTWFVMESQCDEPPIPVLSLNPVLLPL